MKTVAVFFGGESVEHDVSVITGVLTVNSLDKSLYRAVAVYVSNDGKWFTGEELLDVDNFKNLNIKKLQRVALIGGSNILYAVKGKKLKEIDSIAVGINCMHGERGEDGSLAGLLNLCNIPLASPKMLASSVSMDKCATKIFLKGLNLKSLPYKIAYSKDDADKIAKKLEFPLIVKPSNGGSSIGVRRADDLDDLKSAISNALRFGEKVIVEKYLLDATEINCAVYINSKNSVVVSACEKPVSKGDFLSFEDKYSCGVRVFPADIDKSKAEEIQNITKKIYSALEFEGIIRIDYLLDGDKIFVNEINAVPGSLSYYLFCEKLKDFPSLLNTLIETALLRHNRASTVQKKYSSGILSALSGSKAEKRL